MQKTTFTLFYFLFTFFSFGQNSDYEKGIKSFEKENHLEAYKLLKPYAEKGDAKAELIVGVCYFNPELKIKNDSLSIVYLTRSAEKMNIDAMKYLTLICFEKGSTNSKYKIESLVWAEISSANDESINFTSTRYLIREYLNEEELKEVEKILKEKSKHFEKINMESFYAINKKVKKNNQSSDKAKIPENKLNLINDPYSDWVYRWKLEKFECETMFYTAEIETKIIDSTIHQIKKSKDFKVSSLYSDESSKIFKITAEEQSYLISELEKLKNQR